ncbi:class I adenylate-forming enzyme family protein [Rhodococcus sp. NPDC054953]
MTTSTDPQAYLAAVVSRLTGPGAPFELVEEDVRGSRMPVMRERKHAVHELLTGSLAWGDRDYLVTADRRLSFREHAEQVAAFATVLADDYGVGVGDRVAILAANTVEWVIAFWATQSLGAITVGMNAWWVPREIEYGVTLTTPKVLIVDAKRAALVAETDIDVPVLTMEEDVPRLIDAHRGADLRTADVGEDDPAVILFTSGTSGKPKGALHSQRNLIAVSDYHRFSDAQIDAFAGREYDPNTPSELRYLLTSPLFHIASLHNIIVPKLVSGSAVIMYQGAFDVDRALGLVEREKVTNWGAVPTMAARMIEHGNVRRYDTSSLTAFSLASAPSSIAFKQRLREEVPFATNSLVDSYGMTECSTGIAVATPIDVQQFPGTLGKPVFGVALEIRDPLGEVLPEGEEGEVCVRSPYVMLGYWDNPEATAASIRAGGWLHTGDFGRLDGGRLRLTGRRSDLILRGGENIYPTEIEQVLDEHPDVAECAVVGEAHEDLGQEVAAIVVVRAGATVSEEELRQFVADRLSYFKVPTRWRLTTEPLPRNATGKVSRAQVKF